MRRQFCFVIALGIMHPLLALADPVVGPFPPPQSACDGLPGNVLQNCGFETGDFTGWIMSGNEDFTFVENDYAGYAANSGTYFAALGPGSTDGYLSQTFATTPGGAYDITWYLNSNGASPNDFNATWDGTTVFSQTDIPNSNGYALYSFSEVAESSSSTLTFGFRDDPDFLALDDTSAIASAPEPSSYLEVLLIASLALLSAATRRRSRARRAG